MTQSLSSNYRVRGVPIGLDGKGIEKISLRSDERRDPSIVGSVNDQFLIRVILQCSFSTNG